MDFVRWQIPYFILGSIIILPGLVALASYCYILLRKPKHDRLWASYDKALAAYNESRLSFPSPAYRFRPKLSNKNKPKKPAKARNAFSDAIFVGRVASVATLVAIVLGVGVFAPYDTKYYAIYSATGTVAELTNVFDEGSGSLTERTYVVQLADDSNRYVLRDPRIVTLEGERVKLRCTYDWIYEGDPSISCSIAKVLS